ncbi:MAG: chorismate mutase, partial [Alistipes sp.]
LLARRMRIAREIGQYKKEHAMPILQPQRYDAILGRYAALAPQLEIDAEFIRLILQTIHEESVHQQMEVLGR